MSKSKTKQARVPARYIRRAVEDEYAQGQLRDAMAQLRDVYSRISRQQAAATEDKKVYRGLKEAAVSIRKAVARIEEPPPKPSHALRNTLLLGAVTGALLFLSKRS